MQRTQPFGHTYKHNNNFSLFQLEIKKQFFYKKKFAIVYVFHLENNFFVYEKLQFEPFCYLINCPGKNDNLSYYLCLTTISVNGGGRNVWISDGLCDDINNNVLCQFDGGDCCGVDVIRKFCTLCECLGK